MRGTDNQGHKGDEKKGSGKEGIKGSVREGGNGRLDGNRAHVKEPERGRTQEGGVICLAQMESIFAPFHQSCASVWIKAALCPQKGYGKARGANSCDLVILK